MHFAQPQRTPTGLCSREVCALLQQRLAQHRFQASPHPGHALGQGIISPRSAGTSPCQATSASMGPQRNQTSKPVLMLEALILLAHHLEHHAAFHRCILLCSHQPKPMSFHVPKDSSSPAISPCSTRAACPA